MHAAGLEAFANACVSAAFFQQAYGDQSGMGLMSSGSGLGYDRGQYASGHAPPHGMLRQKSIGEVVCFFVCPLLTWLSVCPLAQSRSVLC